MTYDYTPVWSLRPGDSVKLTGPGWRIAAPGQPSYGDVVVISHVEPDHEPNHAVFVWPDQSGHDRPWSIDNNNWSALLVERRKTK